MNRKLLLLIILACSCNKPDPAPWKKDPVYLEIEKKRTALQSSVEAQKTEVKAMRETLKNATPQTGESRNARAKLEKQIAFLEKLNQELRLYTYLQNSRLEISQRGYLESLRNKTAWPPEEEKEEFVLNEEMSAKKRNWNVEERIKQSRLPTSDTQKPEQSKK